jgi:DNA-directed RNA polymerase subunit RPC12/RpoP
MLTCARCLLRVLHQVLFDMRYLRCTACGHVSKV